MEEVLREGDGGSFEGEGHGVMRKATHRAIASKHFLRCGCMARELHVCDRISSNSSLERN